MLDYIKTLKDTKVLYECSQCSVHGTEYTLGTFVLLPESTNSSPVFGKIHKTLCCEEYCYLYYKQTTNSYCSATDLFMITELNSFAVIRSDHLADYHILHGYEVGEAHKISISLRKFVLAHL